MYEPNGVKVNDISE